MMFIRNLRPYFVPLRTRHWTKSLRIRLADLWQAISFATQREAGAAPGPGLGGAKAAGEGALATRVAELAIALVRAHALLICGRPELAGPQVGKHHEQHRHTSGRGESGLA